MSLSGPSSLGKPRGGLNAPKGSLGDPPLMQGLLKSSLRSSLGETALRGSLGEPIKLMESGPRLSNEGPMRSSAEAYLKGSTEVC